MSENRCVDNTFTFKNYQRLEVNKTVNGKFYQFCHSMEVGENYMIYSTHNPRAGEDWAKGYNHLEIYSNSSNLFRTLPPEFSNVDLFGNQSLPPYFDRDSKYYWDLGISYCVCPYLREKSCSEHNTDWKETQGDKLIYYEGKDGSIKLNPLSLFYEWTGFFKPISAKWKKETGTFKLKIEPADNLTDDCDKVNQFEFKGEEFFSDKFRELIANIIKRDLKTALNFNKEKANRRGNFGYIKRGKTGNKVVEITPADLGGYKFEDYQWLKIKDNLNSPIKDKIQSENYENWTKEQLINEIKKLKLEIEELKNDKILSTCSKQAELKKKQAKLEKMEKHFDNKTLDNSTNGNNSNNTDYLPYVLGGMSILTFGIVVGFLVRKRVKKSK